MTQKEQVLIALQNSTTYGLDPESLASALDIPRATVRRIVQELRGEGYEISFAEQGFPYRYFGLKGQANTDANV